MRREPAVDAGRVLIADGTSRSRTEVRECRRGPVGLALLGVVCAMIAFMSGCGKKAAGGETEGSSTPGLAFRFSATGGGTGSEAFDPHYGVTRKGRRRDSMLLVAPVTIKAETNGHSGNFTLEAWCTQVFNTGDGIQMDVYLAGREERRKIYGRYFDAGRRAEDRDWIPISVPLVLLPAQDARVEIEASAGPQGDLTGDWLAVSSARLVPKSELR